jgi:hypothetical protein
MSIEGIFANTSAFFQRQKHALQSHALFNNMSLDKFLPDINLAALPTDHTHIYMHLYMHFLKPNTF